MHLVDSIIRVYHDARSPERQIQGTSLLSVIGGVVWLRRESRTDTVFSRGFLLSATSQVRKRYSHVSYL